MSGSDLYADLTMSPKSKPEGDTTAPADEGLESLMAQVAELEEENEMIAMQARAADETGARKSAPGGKAVGAPAAPEPTSVHVGNLDTRATEQDLQTIFAGCGTITRITILKDRATGQPRGFAYVEFDSAESAAKSLSKENQSLHGRPIKVTIKRENVPAHMRGGGAGGFVAPRGGGFRGGRGGPQGAMNPAMMQGMMQMMGAMASTFMQPQGRGGFRGRGRGGAPTRGRGGQQ
jgi:polyadenylate-binding protein 2